MNKEKMILQSLTRFAKKVKTHTLADFLWFYHLSCASVYSEKIA